VEALRKVFWVKPELVAEIEYAEWTEGASGGSGPKLRAPVFLGLRDDKYPKECLRKMLCEQRTENCLSLLDVLHGQHRAVVAIAGIDRARHD